MCSFVKKEGAWGKKRMCGLFFEVRAGAKRKLCGFEQGFAKGGVGVDRVGDIIEEGVKLDGQRTFCDKLGDMRSCEVDTEQTLCLLVGDKLRKSIGTTECERTTGGFQWEVAGDDFVPSFFGFGLCESNCCDFWICKHHSRDDADIISCGMSCDHFGGDFGFAIRFVCEHRLTCDVTNREDVGDLCAAILIDGDTIVLVE